MKIKLFYGISFLFTISSIYSGVVLVSVPKCGTFLAIKCIKAITKLNYSPHTKTWISPNTIDFNKPFLAGHTIYSNDYSSLIKQKKSKGILILRDPRDQCVSFIYYVKNNSKVWPFLAKMDFDKALSYWMQHTSAIYSSSKLWKDPQILSFKGIDDLYKKYLPWINDPSFYTTTFEKLVGSQGGGSEEDQIQEIMNIAQHIGYPIDIKSATQIGNSLFGNRTFREGQIGSWKKHFTQEHKNLFKQIGGQLLIDLGYEQDLNW